MPPYRANLGGEFGGGVSPRVGTGGGVDLSGLIEAATGGAASLIHGAYLRKVADRAATLNQQREDRESRIQQENADTNKAYRESLGAQKQAQARLIQQEEEMRTPEFRTAYADAVQNGTPESIAKVAGAVAGHPNAQAILAPLLKQPKAPTGHVSVPGVGVFAPDANNTGVMIRQKDDAGKFIVPPHETKPDPIDLIEKHAAVTRAAAATREANTTLRDRPQRIKPVMVNGLPDRAATAANQQAYTADSTRVMGERDAANADLSNVGLRPMAVPAAPPANDGADAIRASLKSGAVTLDHVKAANIPPAIKAKLLNEFGGAASAGSGVPMAKPAKISTPPTLRY